MKTPSHLDAELLLLLKKRFEEHAYRHPGLDWQRVADLLVADPALMASVARMDASGGEPDVVKLWDGAHAWAYADCSAESPHKRRSLCYDEQALAERKENKPSGSALGMALEMGVTLLNEAEYLRLQQVGPFDRKTSGWILTPPEMRNLGGALFGDHRFNRTFFYHNTAQSYYGARGFRAYKKLMLGT
jgi:hypothetical protein